MRRWRAGQHDERVQTGIHISINGIAAGLRNTGEPAAARSMRPLGVKRHGLRRALPSVGMGVSRSRPAAARRAS
jgi:hypothetical protein